VNRRRLALAAPGFAFLLIASGVALRPAVGDAGFLLPIAVTFVALGALLGYRRPANRIGWLFLAFGLVTALEFAAEEYATRALVTHPGSLPAADLACMLAFHFWHASFGLLVFTLLLFPNGRLPSPRWRWTAGVAALTYIGLAITGVFETELLRSDLARAHPLFEGDAERVGTAIFRALLFVNLALLAVSGASLLLRLRRSRGEERQQVKVFVYTVTFVMFAFPISIVVGGLAPLLFPLIPASAAVAILRYRLYDIDVVINRTLVYGALTATLASAYLGSVLLLQLVLSPSSDLAIAGSTLAVAALFRPARRRIQELVDRRFYRSRYDAARTLERFGARLRDEVDLDSLGGELRGVVVETMQPAHVSLWLRESVR
jgi:hypothetical protein